jgi:DNA-binding beta-propeller fold protein YncE
MPTRRTILPAVAAFALSAAAAAAADPLPANGHIIVSTRGDTNLVLIDPVTLTESARVQAPVGLHEIAASPDGRRAVGAAYGSGPRHQTPDQRLLAISLPDLNEFTDDAMTLGPLIDLGREHPRPNDLVFLPDSRHAWCTSEINESVLKIDLDALPPETGINEPANAGDHSAAIVRHLPYGAPAGHMFAVSSDFARCYIPSVADGTVTVLDLESGAVLATPEAGPRAEGVAAAPDGSTVWIGCHGNDTIAVLDAASNEIAHRFDAPGTPFRLRFTADSARVVVSFPSADEVRIFDAATREVVTTISLEPGDAPTSIALSPDNTMIAIVCAGTQDVAIADLATGEIKARVTVGPTPDGLAWAPAP